MGERLDIGPASACAELAAALRDLQDAAAASAPSDQLASTVARSLGVATEALRGAPAPRGGRWFGRLDVPGRGQTMCPPVTITELTSERLRGSVTCTPFYGGFGEGVHGGAVALIMNELMGTLANADPSIVRVAAYIHVDYRSAAPLETALTARADVGQTSGRKQTITSSLSCAGRVIAEGEGLFLGPRIDETG